MNSRTEKAPFQRLRWLDPLFVLRPTLMFPLWTMTLAGMNLAQTHQSLGTRRWVLLTLSLCTLFGLVYLLNQLRDREGDRANGKLPLSAQAILSERWLIGEAIVLGIAAPILLVMAGFGPLGPWMALVFAVAGLLYNFTPAALQRTPWGGVVAGAGGGWLLLRLGEMIAGDAGGFARESPYIAAFTAGCLLTGLPDEDGDRKVGKITFVVRYGARKTMLTALGGFIGSAVLGLINRDLTISVPAVLATPLLALALVKNDRRLAVTANKVAIFLLTIAVGINFPALIAAAALYWPLARRYHRVRLNMTYPSFSGN